VSEKQTLCSKLERGFAVRCKSNGGGYLAFPLDSEDYTFQEDERGAEVYTAAEEIREWMERNPSDDVEIVPFLRIVTVEIGAPVTLEQLEAPSAAATPEVCICAAVQTEEGMVIRGHRHSDAIKAAVQAFCHPVQGEQAQGFITSCGRYVTRQEGRRLQEAAGIGSVSPGGYRGDLLFSEDLY
jgi:hypothetical protein